MSRFTTPLPVPPTDLHPRELRRLTGWGRYKMSAVTGIPENTLKPMLAGTYQPKAHHLRLFALVGKSAGVWQ